MDIGLGSQTSRLPPLENVCRGANLSPADSHGPRRFFSKRPDGFAVSGGFYEENRKRLDCLDKDRRRLTFLSSETAIGPPLALMSNFVAIAANLSGVLGGHYFVVPYHSGPSALKNKPN